METVRNMTSGPWSIERTHTAGVRLVHGEEEDGFRDDVPFGRGKLRPTDEEEANLRAASKLPELVRLADDADTAMATLWVGRDHGITPQALRACVELWIAANRVLADVKGIDGPRERADTLERTWRAQV